ncbi:Sulfite reductase [NADPH] hemoprotein beta-component [Planctomycetes bacterium Pan216]|uniref:Sulfite reductase [NADPH] hemoprotein beta-component n=1 Tax=Kolteria novifilia TaxID=2527975 RepID=A0A518BBM8_9BACT|nr:Sulfite reductase [NADPH] hemoprotein beta-component [Planctomycetes bacterium Pan216]
MAKQSVEEIKEESDYLRGTLAEDIANEELDHLDEAGKQLIKFHGSYQQDDRDIRKERKKQKLGPLYFFMVRAKLPGGKLTADQYLVFDDLCERYANGTMRITSRQGIQFHGVFKPNLKNQIRAMNDALVSTLAACGDVNRNVMCCPAPIRNDSVRDEMQALADRIAEHLCPKTTAYHDIWLNGEKQAASPKGEVVEPIYGKHYLPRKFKIAIALPEDNCVDVLSDDLGILVKHSDGKIEGYNLFVGGGMGMTHGMAKTYPRLATPLCFATPNEVIDVMTAVVKVQRDHGNREDRKQARMKYLIDSWGEKKFHDTVQEYYGKPLAEYTGDRVTGMDDHLGWHDQGDGKRWVGVHVKSGRIADHADHRFRSGLREVVAKHRANVRFTAQANILLCDVDPAATVDINQILLDHGIVSYDDLTKIERYSLACPAIPTCGLALSDSERALGHVLSMLHAEIAALGLQEEDIALHMTGCPNGCVRPYSSDIGIVGRQPNKYTVFLGGNVEGTALSFQYQDLVPTNDLPKVVRGPLLFYKQAREEGEGFGDFCRRKGETEVRSFVESLPDTSA